jgi:hypothetical protein
MPIKHPDPIVQEAGEFIANCAADIESMFKKPTFVSILVRRPTPKPGDQDLLISNDKPADAITAMQIRAGVMTTKDIIASLKSMCVEMCDRCAQGHSIVWGENEALGHGTDAVGENETFAPPEPCPAIHVHELLKDLDQ